MDTSIRFYNTNSNVHSPFEDERTNRFTVPLPTDEQNCAPDQQDTRTSLPERASQGHVQEAEHVNAVDVAGFEAIYTRFHTPIINYIYHLIGNREQAYDLAQDVFIKAYRALLNGTVVQPGALSAWLYRIATNTTTDTLRRRRLIAWLPLSLFNEDRGIGAGVLSDSGGAADGFTNTNEDTHTSSVSTLYERNGYDGGRFESQVADREIVERVMKQLQPKYAVCLWLYENDGLSCAEIAEVLSISSSAVKMRLMRARERFIGLYKKEVGEE